MWEFIFNVLLLAIIGGYLYSDYKFKEELLSWQKTQDRAILDLFKFLENKTKDDIISLSPIKDPEIPLEEKKKFLANVLVSEKIQPDFDSAISTIEDGLNSGRVNIKDIEYIWANYSEKKE
jgi:hypothetical protein